MGLTMNQSGVCNNFHQRADLYPRVLTICSAACLRSPTAAVVLAGEPFNKNARAAGLTDEYAIVKLDEALYQWADEIVVMEKKMVIQVQRRAKEREWYAPEGGKKIICLDIPDNFQYRDPELMTMIAERYTERSSK